LIYFFLAALSTDKKNIEEENKTAEIRRIRRFLELLLAAAATSWSANGRALAGGSAATRGSARGSRDLGGSSDGLVVVGGGGFVRAGVSGRVVGGVMMKNGVSAGHRVSRHRSHQRLIRVVRNVPRDRNPNGVGEEEVDPEQDPVGSIEVRAAGDPFRRECHPAAVELTDGQNQRNEVVPLLVVDDAIEGEQAKRADNVDGNELE